MGFTDQALSLNLGLPSTTTTTARRSPTNNTDYEPSLTLSLSGGPQPPSGSGTGSEQLVVPTTAGLHHHHLTGKYNYYSASQYSSSPRGSVVSSISGVKRERDHQVKSEQVEAAAPVTAAGDGDCRGLPGGGGSDEDDEETIATHSNNSHGQSHSTVGGVRKKLRLSKDQSAMLEESFKQHSTLNPKQKQALANQLNLRPRQVEVWFQNRRARTKLKQTEVDCEFLKKCCETLTEENRRLQKEVHELRTIKQLQLQYAATTTSSSPQRPPTATAPYIHHQHHLQPPTTPTTLTMCPSCERVCRSSSGLDSTTASKPISKASSKSHFVYAFAAGAAAAAHNTAKPSAGTAC